ncbi:MAG: sulfatase [Verrucomicrobiae bacterium]|nr:sulfatase [Verrucomicrobiae bacterium]
MIATPGSLSAADGDGAGKADRPNILFAFADDWGHYASIYAEAEGAGTANDVVKTPNFDRIAREGVLFKNAHVTAPSCTPCRSSLLSGQYFFRTGRGAILQGAIWDTKIPTYPLMLRDAGYHIGKIYKVWSPGEPRDAPYGEQEYGYEMKGPNFNSFSQTATKLVEEGKTVAEAKQLLLDKVGAEFDAFLEAKPDDEPFCFWFGPTNTHRMWTRGSGKALWGLEPDNLKGKLPDFLPDVPLVREDFADYLGEAMAFDAGLGVLLKRLEKAGQLDNTLVVVSGDHGAPGFPRGKCNLYDFGTNVSLAARWGNGKIPAGRVVDDFVNLMDLAPTFLEAGGVTPPEVMTGRSLMPVLTSEKSGQVDPERTWVITGRERHVGDARPGGKPYPQRAFRTKDHVFIVNFEPDRWPMGDPGDAAGEDIPDYDTLANNTFAAYADFDASPTKAWMIEHRNDPEVAKLFELGFGKRPKYELYDLSKDADEIENVAGYTEYADVQADMEKRLMAELKLVNDPRVTADPVPFENAPFTDIPPRKKPKKK